MSTQQTSPTPTRGVPVTLDKERRLRYTFATRRAIIAELGGDESKITSGLKGDDLITVLWYGLKWEDPEVTREMVEEAVDLENLSVIVDALAKAMGYKEAKTNLTGPQSAQAPSASS